MTCQRQALNLGKRLFSIQNETECRVRDDDEENPSKQYGPAPPTGNEICSTKDGMGYNTGGPNTMALYQNEHTTQTYGQMDVGQGISLKHYGCYNDSDRRQPFSGGVETRESVMPFPSVVECARLATMEGKKFFGVETGTECRWSDSLSQATQLLSAESGSCPERDNLGKPTGGKWTFDLYEVPDEAATKLKEPVTNWDINIGSVNVRYRGCYRANGDRLKGLKVFGKHDSIKRCGIQAATRGKHWFALNSDKECHVGDDPTAFMLPGWTSLNDK